MVKRFFLRSGYEAEVFVSYECQKEFEYLCSSNGIRIVNKEYFYNIRNVIEISEEKYAVLIKKDRISSFCNLTNRVLRAKYIVIPQ